MTELERGAASGPTESPESGPTHSICVPSVRQDSHHEAGSLKLAYPQLPVKFAYFHAPEPHSAG